MRQNYSFSKNSNALLEPCEGKLSCTVLRGESPSNGADLLDKGAGTLKYNAEKSHKGISGIPVDVQIKYQTHYRNGVDVYGNLKDNI